MAVKPIPADPGRRTEMTTSSSSYEACVPLLIEKNSDAILVIDTEGTIRFANPSAEKIFGRTPENLVGEAFGFPVGDEEATSIQILGAGGGTKTAEMRIVDVNWGGDAAYLATIRDITELARYRRRLEEMVEQRTRELHRALLEAEEARDRADGILKSVADGLVVTDTRDRVVMMNRAAEEALGIRLSEVIHRPIEYAILDDTLRERIRSTFEKRATGYQFDFELPGQNRSRMRVMRARTSVLQDKKGNHAGIVTILYDVTYEREIARMKNEFIATAAHELRTPVTSIRGFSEILMTRKELAVEETRKFLRYIHEQSSALAEIINDLLDLSRIESGEGFALEKAETDLCALIRKVTARHADYSKIHRFEVALPAGAIRFSFDAMKIEQVMDNILDNAVKYSPDGGVIRSGAKVENGRCTVRIEDQGIGMTREQAARVFERFYRADASNTAVSGTGLGMSIVERIVEAHGGKITVKSKPNQGTLVQFWLPVEISETGSTSRADSTQQVLNSKGVGR